MDSFNNDPNGTKNTIEYYKWNVKTDKENYHLECSFNKNIDNEIGNLNIIVPAVSLASVLNKECKIEEINYFINFVKNYINLYP